MAEETLSDEGYRHYEVSAYAREKYVCSHNLNYWRFGDYLGIGAGAHSKVSMSDRVIRTWKLKNPKEYLSKSHSEDRIGGRKSVSTEDIRFEFMLNALRLRDPIPTLLFQQHTAQPIVTLKAQLEEAQKDNLLQFDGKSITTTPHGQRFLNELLQRFLPN